MGAILFLTHPRRVGGFESEINGMVELNVEKKNNKNDWLKIVGFVGAGFLIVFGNLGNFLRTIKLVGQKKR